MIGTEKIDEKIQIRVSSRMRQKNIVVNEMEWKYTGIDDDTQKEKHLRGRRTKIKKRKKYVKNKL